MRICLQQGLAVSSLQVNEVNLKRTKLREKEIFDRQILPNDEAATPRWTLVVTARSVLEFTG